MRSIRLFLVCLTAFAAMATGRVDAEPSTSPARFVRSIVDAAPADLTFADAKLKVDIYVDPFIDTAAIRNEIARLSDAADRIARAGGGRATDMDRLQAVRIVLHTAGAWNDGRPFAYDLDDPFGQTPGAQSLSGYFATRKGNCVSMPMLFLAVGERLGLDLTLSTAPLHVLVRFTDRADGRTWNVEATSGGGFARDAHYRRILPMTDEAIRNGVYMKTLSRREALALIATPVLDHLLATGRYDDAIAVADVLVEANPADTYAMVKKGTAYYRLLQRDFIRKYPREADIPAAEMSRALALSRANRDAFARAEALGWREPKLN